MLFNSFQFIWLFPIIFVILNIVFYNCSSRIKNVFLLLVSYLLYIQYKPAYALLLLGITAITYIGAYIIEKYNAFGKRRYIVIIFSILTLLPLFIFKYYNFLNESISDIFALLGWQIGLPGLNWVIPLGISFFSFQAVGYLWDVYYRHIKAEHNFFDYMLFISFFPQIASGPISKAKDLLPQIKSERPFNYKKAVQGCKWLLWGMFLKVVLADRTGMLVDTILPNYMYLNGTTCALGAFLYSFQIYGDFAGYSFMAIGVGRLLGFDLINNFNRPYLAATITEFWRRWHISLTKWLTDYVYIPLGGSRCSKFRNYINIIITFLVSGIWHGANYTFIVWGLIHGIVQSIEKAFKIQKCENAKFRMIRIIITFFIVTIAWIFFRMPTLESSIGILKNIFTNWGIPNFTASVVDKLFIFGSILILVIVEYFEEYKPSFSLINNRNIVIRWGTYIALIFMILLCGVFDAGSFIYVNF